MIYTVKDDEHLEALLKQERWVLNAFREWHAPYNHDIYFTFYKRRFHTKVPLKKTNMYNENWREITLAELPNLADIDWKYDDETGLLTNDVIAIRIK